MSKCAVIADDLTGANATGALLIQKGLKVIAVVNYRMATHVNLAPYDGVVINTFSRGIPKNEAQQRVKETASILWDAGVRYFGKRIDSTIRGNLGAEVEGILTALGQDYVAVVVPAYPRSGRTVVGGYLLVNGVPVELTDAGRDPKTPVRSSEVLKLIAEQTSLPGGCIHLSTVLKGPGTIIRKIQEELALGKKIIVVDAVSDNDIENIAAAVKEAGIKAVAVDPGPFSQALLTRWLGRDQERGQGKVMLVAGSATSLTRMQLDCLREKYRARFVNIDVRSLLENELRPEREADIVNQVMQQSEETNVFGLRVAEKEEMVIDLEAEAVARGVTADVLAERITAALARIACRVLALGIPDLKGVYLTGGDMTAAFCKACGAWAIELRGEVLPLAAYGILQGGEFSGLPVVTKGGLVGAADGALKCVEYLLSTGTKLS